MPRASRHCAEERCGARRAPSAPPAIAAPRPPAAASSCPGASRERVSRRGYARGWKWIARDPCAPWRGPRRIEAMLFFAAAVAALALALPLALAAPPLPVTPGERIDLKVLLISTDGSEPGYGAWRAALDREGVPYETFVAFAGQARTATLDDARLADYAAHRARFQA